jgi:hypothetical protein
MSQRLILKNSRACGKTTKDDLVLASLGLRGSTPNDDGGDGGDGSEGQNVDDSGDGDGSGSEDRDGNGGGSGDDAEGAEDSAALKRRMQAADRRAAEAERRLKEIEDANLSEQQKKDRELEDLRSFREQADSQIANLTLQVSFLSVNDVQWHDPAIALSQVDLDAIKDDEGKVDKKALKREIERLKKDRPYLVKSASTGGDSGGGAGEGGHGASGSGVGSGTGGKKGGGLSEEELRRRYPSLNV